MGKLTAVAVKAALANPGTYQDGDGLVLRVDKRGGAYSGGCNRARWPMDLAWPKQRRGRLSW